MADRGPQKAGAYERPARLKGWIIGAVAGVALVPGRDAGPLDAFLLGHSRIRGRVRLGRHRKLGRGPLGRLPLPGWSAMRETPVVPESTFREWWRERRAG